jgi:hypothetical protein
VLFRGDEQRGLEERERARVRDERGQLLARRPRRRRQARVERMERA